MLEELPRNALVRLSISKLEDGWRKIPAMAASWTESLPSPLLRPMEESPPRPPPVNPALINGKVFGEGGKPFGKVCC